MNQNQTTPAHYAAIDLGAESGRIIVGTLEPATPAVGAAAPTVNRKLKTVNSGGEAAFRLTLAEHHRFPTGGHRAPDGSYRWDIDRITAEIFKGLRKIAAKKIPLRSISADSWGVDYVWLDASGNLLAQPRHYRDERNAAALARTLKKIPREKIFAETGLQFLNFNTLYQLEADIHDHAIPAAAAHFLCIADYINYLLSGRPAIEQSLASTTQLYNPVTRDWSRPLAAAIGLPEKLLPEIVPSATILTQTLTPAAAKKTRLPANTPVIATCSHDTEAAIFAVPATGAAAPLRVREWPDTENCKLKTENSGGGSAADGWAYLSSGTWSLLGVELEKPIITPDVLAADFTNETGCNHTALFLKTIIGMWLIQECRRVWKARGTGYTYAQLAQLAAQSEPLRTLVNPDDPRFATPGDMPRKIADYARETGQHVPRTHGETIRAALDSLALHYDLNLTAIEKLTAKKIATLHIVGGGSQNTLLNQLIADATCRTVHAGPVEATAIGNILLQALALGDIPGHAAARQIIRDSFPLKTHTPRQAREKISMTPIPPMTLISPMKKSTAPILPDYVYQWRPGSDPKTSATLKKFFNSPKIRALKQRICDMGRRMWEREFTDGNGGNMTIRVGDNLYLTTQTLISKGFMAPDTIALVDGEGRQLAGKYKRTSECLTHLAIYKNQPAARATCHAHPVHATAFAIAGLQPPAGMIPEAEVFLGQIGLAPYATPGTPAVAEAVGQAAINHHSILMVNHGVITWGSHIEDAFWKMENTESYCKTIHIATTLGAGLRTITAPQMRELIALRKSLGMSDPRENFTDAQLLDNTAFLSRINH